MALKRWMEGDVSEDGHPCEAALEFRRAAIRFGAVDEVPADALDLAVSFAWIGKAVSRTVEAGAWVLAGTDPNTWQMIRAMAADSKTRKVACRVALSSPAAAFFGPELEALRACAAFRNAAKQAEPAVSMTAKQEEGRFAVLSSIARSLPGPELPCQPANADNLVVLSAVRKRLAGTGM